MAGHRLIFTVDLEDGVSEDDIENTSIEVLDFLRDHPRVVDAEAADGVVS